MRRSYLALIALTLGLLTLACSGGGSSLLGPGAVTDSGLVDSHAIVGGTAALPDPAHEEPGQVGTPRAAAEIQMRVVHSSRGDVEPIE
jgi:hypothetical protein